MPLGSLGSTNVLRPKAESTGCVLSPPGYAKLLNFIAGFRSSLNDVESYAHLPIPLVYTQVIEYTCPYPSSTLRSYCTVYSVHQPIPFVFTQVILYTCPYPIPILYTCPYTPRLYAGHTVHLPIPLVFTQVIQYTFCPSSDRTKIS